LGRTWITAVTFGFINLPFIVGIRGGAFGLGTALQAASSIPGHWKF